MTSTTNHIRLQSNLKDHVKGECELRNTRNGTHIITKGIVDYSAMEFYLEKNNLHYTRQESVIVPQIQQWKIFPTTLKM
jgi:hypothetical protein